MARMASWMGFIWLEHGVRRGGSGHGWRAVEKSLHATPERMPSMDLPARHGAQAHAERLRRPGL